MENMDAYIHKCMHFLNDLLRISGLLGHSRFKDKWNIASPDGKSQSSKKITDHRKGNCGFIEDTTSSAGHTIEILVEGL